MKVTGLFCCPGQQRQRGAEGVTPLVVLGAVGVSRQPQAGCSGVAAPGGGLVGVDAKASLEL